MDIRNQKVEQVLRRKEQKNILFQKAGSNYMVLNKKTMAKIDQKSEDVSSFVSSQLGKVKRSKNLPF